MRNGCLCIPIAQAWMPERREFETGCFGERKGYVYTDFYNKYVLRYKFAVWNCHYGAFSSEMVVINYSCDIHDS